MIEAPGSQVLYRAATGLEKALADSDAERIMGLKAELVIESWDPHLTQYKNLPFLAWAHGVNLWEDHWSEETRREWVARQWEFKSLRGTIAGIKMAIEYAGRDAPLSSGYRLIDWRTPPQAFFISPDLTPEQFREWLHLMPELRISVGAEPGHALGDEAYLDDGFLDIHAVAYDNGPELYGRRAILRRAGLPDLNLKVIQRSRLSHSYEAIDWEDISTPGLSTCGLFLGEDFIDADHFLDCAEVEPKLYRIRINRALESHLTTAAISAVAPTLEPIDVTYERHSEIGDADSMVFVGDGSVGLDFIGPDDAPLMLADRLWLLDPDVSVPMTEGLSFLDVDRLGFPKYTMELMVDLGTRAPGPLSWIGEAFMDETFLTETDLSHFDRGLRAVVAGKALRDKALVAFDPLRPIEASDPVNEATPVDAWVPNVL